jgi:hypothetical protein
MCRRKPSPTLSRASGRRCRAGGDLTLNQPRHWEVTADAHADGKDEAGAPLSISRWKEVWRRGRRATATILITALLGVPIWVGAQAARPNTPEIFSATAEAKNAKGAVSGALEVRLNRYTPDFDRKTVEAALKEGGYPKFLLALRNAPEVGQLVLAGGEPFSIRYALKVEAGGRTIVLVTDKPV